MPFTTLKGEPPLDPPEPRVSDEQIETRALELAEELRERGYITVDDGQFYTARYTVEDDVNAAIDLELTQDQWETFCADLVMKMATRSEQPILAEMRAAVDRAVMRVATKAAEKERGV